MQKSNPINDGSRPAGDTETLVHLYEDEGAVVWEKALDDPLIVYPLTAYDAASSALSRALA